MKKFTQILNETNNDYAVNDVVLIKFYLDGELTPVVITRIDGNLITVSHKKFSETGLGETNYRTAPDQVIRKWQIIGLYYGADTPAEPASTSLNPTYNPPDHTGSRGYDYRSNDINIQ